MKKNTNHAAPVVVVVDDNKTLHAQFKKSIEKIDIELNLMGFLSAAEATDYLKNNKPKIIFLDILMPDKDGIKFLTELRRLDIHQSTCVIMITSKDYAQDRKLAHELGAVEFLTKPIPMKALTDVILKYID